MANLPASRSRHSFDGVSPRSETPNDVDAALLKALNSPLRMRMLHHLNERVSSPKELATEFGVSVELASYHCRVLRDAGCIELVETTRTRGATAHHYRALRRAMIETAEWSAMTVAERRPITQAVLEGAFTHAFEALHAGTLDDRPERHISWTDLQLDARGWAEVNTLIDETWEKATRLQAESAARLAKSGEAPIRTRVTLLHYQAANAGPIAPPDRSGPA